MTGEDLILEVTMEQGPARMTQVQPPRGAWEVYFCIDLDDPPHLTLTNRVENVPPEVRPVVEHDHVWTVEIPGAVYVGQTILRFHRTAPDAYDYWLYHSPQPEYHACVWLLANFNNPHHHKGRKWLVI